MANLSKPGKGNLPNPLPLKKLIGPSFIILGAGLGSGELILWPYLTSNFGLGLIWAAILGITFQFFINMEIERYTLVTGESIFVGLTRRFGKITPYWFILTTLIPWLWPGIIASSAKVFSSALGITYSKYIGIGILLFLGLLYSLGEIIYKTQEKVQKAIILVGIPFIIFLTILFIKIKSLVELGKGIIGIGENYFFLPNGLPIAIFLGALAYAGAGGNLNLAQSLYIKEKGYGMAKWSGNIINIFSNKKEELKLEGLTLKISPENISKFNTWWKRINIEHAIVFWLTGVLTMLLLSLLSFETVYKDIGVETSINFIIREGSVIASRTSPLLEKLFFLITGLMLFGTQFSVYGSSARICSENLVIINKEKFSLHRLPKFFFIFLWLQILLGILIFAFGFTEPLALVVIGAVLNAISMFIYTGMILLTNLTLLEKQLRPSLFRIIFLLTSFIFYGTFSIFIIFNNFQN